MSIRTLPPTAAPSSLVDLMNGVAGLLRPRAAVERLTRELKDALGVEHVFLLSSGRAAFTLILTALMRLSSRRRVIVPAYTCFSVPAAVVRAGLDVVPCDIDPATLDFDHANLEALLSGSPALCVVPTHLFGLPADVARVRAACQPDGIFVVEDAAQAFGIRSDSGWLGTAGDVGFFSFARGKTVSACGGGAIVTNSDHISRALELACAELPSPGALSGILALAEAAATSILVRPALYWLPAHLPFLGLGETLYTTRFGVAHLSGAQAGLLLDWRRRATDMNSARTARIVALGAAAGRLAPSNGSACLRLPVLCRSREERDRLCAAGAREGLGLSPMYPSAINRIPELRGMLGDACFPRAESVAERLLTVPVHPMVSAADLEAIKAIIAAVTTGGEE